MQQDNHRCVGDPACVGLPRMPYMVKAQPTQFRMQCSCMAVHHGQCPLSQGWCSRWLLSCLSLLLVHLATVLSWCQLELPPPNKTRPPTHPPTHAYATQPCLYCVLLGRMMGELVVEQQCAAGRRVVMLPPLELLWACCSHPAGACPKGLVMCVCMLSMTVCVCANRAGILSLVKQLLQSADLC